MIEWFVYILECEDGSYYVGMTDNIDRRFKEHKSGEGGHFTRYKKIEKLLYSEKFDCKEKAENREKQLKRWTKKKKEALIQGNLEELKRLSRSAK